jgi:hypothetical protein
MSSVENRTKRDEMQLVVLANDRSTLVNMHQENDRSTLMNLRRANNRPYVRSFTLGVQLTW